MKKALGKVREYWRFQEARRINMGGLNVAVYMLVRTDKPYVKWTGGDKATTESTLKDSNNGEASMSKDNGVKSSTPDNTEESIQQSLADATTTTST